MIALLTACGTDLDAEPAQPLELCSATDPVLLLPLTPDQRPDPRGQTFQALDDRLLFVIGSGQRKLEDSLGPIPERGSVYAVGLCGEDPREIGPDVDQVFTSEHFPGAVFGCRWNTGELVRLDPTGAKAPEELAAECPAAFTKHGFVAYDPDLGRSFYPTLDPATATFGDPIALADHVAAPFTSDVHVLSDELLVLDADNALIRVSLPDLATSVELEDIASLKVSDDGRYVMTQGFVLGEDGTEEIHVHDRSDGRVLDIGRGGQLDTSGSRFVSADHAIVRSVSGADFQYVVTLPDFGKHLIPTQYSLRVALPDGRWLAVRDGSWFVLDLLDEENDRMVTEQEGYVHAWTDEYVDLRTGDTATVRDTSPLMRFFFDPAKKPVELAPRVTRNAVVLSDGSIVTPVEVDESWLGGLVLVDPEDPKEHRIDERVAANAVRVGQYPGQPDVVIYAVVDGDRSGVYITRPAAQDQE